MLVAGEQAVVLDLRDGRAHVRTVRTPHVDGWVARRFLTELPPQGHRCGGVSVLPFE